MNSDNLIRGICSFFIPSLGQFMNGEIEKGLKFLIGFVIIWIVLFLTRIIYIQNIAGIIIRLFAAYDAYTYDGF